MDAIIEAALHPREPIWQFIHEYQPLIAGSFALLAAFVTALILGYQGKRERAFRMKQHKIEMQTKRYATALMLAAEILSVTEIVSFKSLAENAKEDAKNFERSGDDELPTLPFFPPMDKLFLNNYSNYIENMPLMRVQTVQEVSRFYFFATRLSEAIESSNVKMGGNHNDETRKSFIIGISDAAKIANDQHEKTVPLLVQEVAEAEIELARLEGIIKRLAQLLFRLSTRALQALLRMRAGDKQTP